MADLTLVRLARRPDAAGAQLWGPWHVISPESVVTPPDALCGRSTFSQDKAQRETRLDVGAVQGKRCPRCTALVAARRAAGPAAETRACVVTWERIGRSRPMPYDIAVPVPFDQRAMDALTAELYAYANGKLGSRHWSIDVYLNPDTFTGEVLLGGGRFGEGKITPKEP